MRKVLFAGCSFTAGWRLPGEKFYPDLWCNQLFPDHTVTNVAWHGANNEGIFHEVCRQIRLVHYDKIVVAWTSIPRYTFNLGLELWDTSTRLVDQAVELIAKQTVTGEYLAATGDRLRKFHNDHWDILKVVQYVNIILDIARYHQQGRVYFINALLPWCNDYFRRIDFERPSELDPYVQDMLQVEDRDDEQVKKLYKKIHTDYAANGGIQMGEWLNLYQSLDSIKVDTIAKHDYHPGIRSQRVFVEKLRERLCDKQN